MVIGYDGYNAVNNNKYRTDFSRVMLEKQSQLHPENQYIIYTPKVTDNKYLTTVLTHRSIRIKQQHKGLTQFVWRSVNGILRSLKRHRVQVYHGLCSELPLMITKSGIPTVLTFEDTEFLCEHCHLSFCERTLKRFMARKSCANAHHITVLSQAMKQHIVDTYSVDPSKVEVIPPSVISDYDNLNEGILNEAKYKYGIVEDEYILVKCNTPTAISSTIVKALAQCSGKTLDLLLVGKYSKPLAHAFKKEAARCGYKGHIRNITKSYHNRMAALITMARACVLTGSSSTFPFNVVGAQYLGVPVISGPQYADIVGDAAIIADVNDVQDLARALSQVNTDEALRATLIERGKAVAVQYHADTIADRYDAIYHNLFGR